MDKDEEQASRCSMDETDAQGQSNLCCCYIIDADGNYDDPCYQPVGECCCCGK